MFWTHLIALLQWFSAGVPQKAVGVPPISKFDWYLLENCSYECPQNVEKPGRVPRIKKGWEPLHYGVRCKSIPWLFLHFKRLNWKPQFLPSFRILWFCGFRCRRDNHRDDFLEFFSPALERFRGQIRFRNSDNSDPREKSGEYEKQDNTNEPNGSDGQTHNDNLK